MQPDRRTLLAALAASIACSSSAAVARTAKAAPPAALLVPLSGEDAALGRTMARAVALAQGTDAKGMFVLDSAGDPAAAVQVAIKRGARLLLGPLRERDIAAVVQAAGGVPVIAFTNDVAAAGRGAFLLGITADQVVAPLLAYARGRGVRKVALAPSTTPWGGQVKAAAERAAAGAGIALTASDDADALLAAEPVPAGGLQLLLAPAGLDLGSAQLAAIEGAWLCAPNPGRFGEFVAGFEAANGATPGLIAGLAYDAARIAVAVRAGGGSDRSALLATSFRGVCGDVRFRADGSADRAMAILAIENGRYRIVEDGGWT